MLSTFLRLTVIVALAIAATVIIGFLLKLVILAAVVAGIVLAVLFVVNLFRRRTAVPARYRQS